MGRTPWLSRTLLTSAFTAYSPINRASMTIRGMILTMDTMGYTRLQLYQEGCCTMRLFYPSTHRGYIDATYHL